MNIKQFNNRLQKASDDLVPAMLAIAKGSIITRKAEVQTRLVESGIDADGKPLAPYTPGYQQFKQDVGRFRGHVDLSLGNYSLNKRAAAVERRRKRRNKIAKAVGQRGRSRTGLLAEEILLSRMGLKKKIKASGGATLWQSINLVHEEMSNTQVLVRVAPVDAFNKKKAEGLSFKRGNFLRFNADEQQHSVDDIDIGFNDYLKQKLGST